MTSSVSSINELRVDLFANEFSVVVDIQVLFQ